MQMQNAQRRLMLDFATTDTESTREATKSLPSTNWSRKQKLEMGAES
jgi:hypothetical protein